MPTVASLIAEGIFTYCNDCGEFIHPDSQRCRRCAGRVHSKKMMGNTIMVGRKHSTDTVIKMSKSHQGNLSHTGRYTSQNPILKEMRKHGLEIDRSARNLARQLQEVGITYGRYLEEVDKASGLCSICKRPEKVKGRLAIDHDHETGKYRSLLCTRCNTVLGLLEDDPELIVKMGKYLASHD